MMEDDLYRGTRRSNCGRIPRSDDDFDGFVAGYVPSDAGRLTLSELCADCARRERQLEERIGGS
jgi:hypothetical protein